MVLTYLIIGLGNIGSPYRGTFHNAGFDVLDQVLSVQNRIQSRNTIRWKMDFHKLMHYAELSHREPHNNNIAIHSLLVKPATLMNLSGKVIAPLQKKYQFQCDQVIVVLDNLDLPIGKSRLKWGTASSSHNGLQSLYQYGFNQKFWRLFIGIGQPEDKSQVNRYVLSKPRPKIASEYQNSLSDASTLLQKIVSGAHIETVQQNPGMQRHRS